MKFALRNGPWKTVFEGTFQGHYLEISINPGQVMLTAIFEKEADEISGVVLQAFSLFSAVGEAENFVESLEREAIILSRHDGKRTVQFLALASKPAYAKGSEEKVAETADQLLEQVAKLGGKVKGIAKSFDLQLTPLEKCSSAVKQAFFSQPAIIPMLVREERRIEQEKEEAGIEGGVEGAGVLLGTTRAGRQVKEPLQLFQRTVVSDGSLQQRVHFIQIIVESYLLANVPVVIFDRGNNFSGLRHPTKKVAELQSHGMQIEPIGFPTKDFTPGENIKINLNVLSPVGLLQLFGCQDKEAEKVLVKAFEAGKVDSPAQLLNRIEGLGSEQVENLFLKRRVERIVSLVDTLYPEMFDGSTNLGEIVKTWFKKIGRVSIVNINSLDPRELTLLLDSLSNEFVNLFKQQGETGKPLLLVAIPQIEPIFSVRDNLVLKDFTKMLAEMQKFGIGFIIGGERKTDLNKQVLQMAETKASIIKETDVAIDMPDSKNYRLLMRPTLSRRKEEE